MMLRTIIFAAVALAGSLAQAATHTVFYAAATGSTLYAYPASQSLTDWTTYRVALTEDTGDNVGRYTGSVDDANGATWYLFSGATQPTSWGDAIAATSVIRKANVVQINDATAVVPLNSTETQAAAASALAAYDPPTNAELEARTIVAANYATAANLATALSQTTASAIRSAVGLASANLDTQFSNIGGGSAVSADVVSAKRTWIADDYRARNIVEVEENFAGVLALKPDLNPGTTIASVDSVSITGAATVTATSLTVDRSKTKAHFTVPALTTTGTYTVVVTVTTIEGDVIPTTATLKVY